MTLVVQGRDPSEWGGERCRLCESSEAESHLIPVHVATRTYFVCEACIARLETSDRERRRAG